MISYILVNDNERKIFEKKYQLPYGCWNTAIYTEITPAISMLENMSQYKRNEYCIEKWDSGQFVETIINGSDL